MTPNEIEITILPDGKVELHIQGIKGKACVEVAKFFETLVGEIKSLNYTSEYYEPEQDLKSVFEQKIQEKR